MPYCNTLATTQKDDILKAYFSRHITDIKDKISADISDKTVDKVVRTFLKFHLTDKGSKSFQDYYFSILTNENLFLTSKTFFRDFKRRYSLQGIDNEYLDSLETNKKIILSLLHQDKLADLYFDYFAKAQIKHGKTKKTKDLGSFFAKLVHTFKPNDYCALDNPIKKHFGLKKESFFVSFGIISSAYKLWATDNDRALIEIRQNFKAIDRGHIMRHDKITDLKLLDLIYWSKANNN